MPPTRRSIGNRKAKRRPNEESQLLRLATEFANADLAVPGALAEWTKRLAPLIWRLGSNIVTPFAKPAQPLTREQLDTMQSDARELFTVLTAMKNGQAIESQPIGFPTVGVSVIETLPGRPVLVVIRGNPADMFSFHLVRALERGDLSRVRRCPDTPTCQNFFFKAGRKNYCSERCRKRVKMRHRRAEERRRNAEALAAVQRSPKRRKR